MGESVMENKSGHRQTCSLVPSLSNNIEDSNENVNTCETKSVGAFSLRKTAKKGTLQRPNKFTILCRTENVNKFMCIMLIFCIFHK